MANETQYYKFPFAENGNREDVPDESVSGNVSFETGYGPDYELAQGDPNRKRIPRTAYNEVLNGVTKNIKQWQEYTFPTWVEDNGDGVAFTYSKGPILSHNGEIWVSLEDGNDDEPTSASDKWLLFDPSLFDIEPIFENYLKPNQNLNVPYGDAVLPNAIAEDYAAGGVFAYDYEAVTNIVGMARTGGVTSGTSGTYMRSYEGDFSDAFFGVQLADGTVSQTGVDIDYNVRKVGYTTVAVNLAVAPDHYCVVLSPAEGRVAVINDCDSKDADTKMALNAEGEAPIYACRAWANFNGVGVVSIRESGNISSIIDNGVGNYTVNYIEEMEDGNYSANTTAIATESSVSATEVYVGTASSFTVNSLIVIVINNNSDTYADAGLISLSIVR